MDAEYTPQPIDMARRTRLKLGALTLAMALGMATPPDLSAKPQRSSTGPIKLLILGDSLSAEYGLPRGSGWVTLVEKRLRASAPANANVQVINASISGETTSGGLRRLPGLLQQHQPTHVVIELGANDALRGLSLKATRDNLDQLVSASQGAGAKVLLVGMMLPPNFGQRYGKDFADLFGQVAQARKTALVPFFLKGVADRPDARDWFQADGIHPLAKAHPVMADLVWQGLKPLL